MINGHLARGVPVIPKSVMEKRIHENADIGDSTLNEADITAVDATDCNPGGGPALQQVAMDTFHFKVGGGLPHLHRRQVNAIDPTRSHNERNI